MTPDEKRFLDLLGWSEGTSTAPWSRNNGYDVIVTGADGKHETFTDYSRHPFANRPPKLIGTFNGSPVRSSASGRYQIIFPTWDRLRVQLSLTDFSPASQDAAGALLLHQCGAGAALAAGDIQTAAVSASKVWASLPGSRAGQGGKTMDAVLAKWKELA